jgi:hypothetical protein
MVVLDRRVKWRREFRDAGTHLYDRVGSGRR